MDYEKIVSSEAAAKEGVRSVTAAWERRHERRQEKIVERLKGAISVMGIFAFIILAGFCG